MMTAVLDVVQWPRPHPTAPPPTPADLLTRLVECRVMQNRGCFCAENSAGPGRDRWMSLVRDVIYHLHNNLNKRPLAAATATRTCILHDVGTSISVVIYLFRIVLHE